MSTLEKEKTKVCIESTTNVRTQQECTGREEERERERERERDMGMIT